MRLGILIPPRDSRPAGLGVYVDQVVSRLVSRHSDCVLFSVDDVAPPNWSAESPFDVPRLGRVLGPASSALPPALSRLLLINSWLPRALRSRDVDVLFIPFQLALWSPGVPQVVVIHDLRALRLPSTSSFPARAFLQRYLRPSVRRAARVVAVSKNTKHDLQQLWQLADEDIEVVYEGYDTEIFHPYSVERIDEERNRHAISRHYAIYVGTFAEHKNLKTALHALSLVQERFPNFQLVLAGRKDAGDYGNFIEEVERSGLRESVRVLGYVPTADLAPLIAGASAFLFPTLYEGFGLSALEAMACGTPVLASNVASLPEVVGSGGYLLDPMDPGSWARTLNRLLAGRVDIQDLRAKALQQAGSFNWSRTADRILEILGDVFEKGRRRDGT